MKPDYTFDCGDGRTILIEYYQNYQVMQLAFEGMVYHLTRTRSASGARYSNGYLTFWEKGGTAFIERHGQIVAQKCVVQVDNKP